MAAAKTLTIGSTGKTFDGSANVAWSLADIGAQAALTNPVTGTGSANYIPKLTGGSTLASSVIYETGTRICIGNITPGIYKLNVTGTGYFSESVTSPAFLQTSDLGLKDIISQNGDVVRFTWKDKRDEKVHIGYIAQEIQQQYPDQVQQDDNGILSVNYIEVLVAKIEELENRIKQLEK